MLRIAVPNKGTLAEPAATMLREAGYRQRAHGKELALHDADNDVEFFYLRPRDIAIYVGQGTVDLGITGRDLLLDSETKADEVLALGFGGSSFRLAAPAGVVTEITQLDGQRVATSLPGLLRGHLERSGVSAEVIRLDGAVESSVRLGVADAVADVVETGTTLRNAGLALVGEPILVSEAVLIRGQSDPDTAPPPAVSQLVRRLQNVLVARRYVMLDYDVAEADLERACAITPGLESPTISPLHTPGWFAVRAMVPRQDTNRIMDELWDVGARAILATDIGACRI